jgi:hypothetical protein
MTDMTKTLELYKYKPDMKTGSSLARATFRWIVRERKPSFGPAIAIFEVLAERRHVRNPKMLASASILVRLFLAKSDRGWNDYHMGRWQLTGDREELVEIHQRCQHIYDKGASWSAVWQSAQWMTNSYRKQDSSFDTGMEAVEQECGCPREVKNLL